MNLIMYNPEIIKQTNPFQTEEGCFSLIGVRKCTRYEEIEVRYQDINFKQQRQKLSESHAIQNRQKAMARPASLIRAANQGHIMESVNTISKSEIAISKTSEPTAQVLVLQPRNLAVKSGKEVR